MSLIVPPTGIIKPHPWPVDPLRTEAPELWRGAIAVLPFWGLPPLDLVSRTGPTIVAGTPGLDYGLRGSRYHSAAGSARTWPAWKLFLDGHPEVTYAIAMVRLANMTSTSDIIMGVATGAGALRGWNRRGTDLVRHSLHVTDGPRHSGEVALPLGEPVLLTARWRSGLAVTAEVWEVPTGRLLASGASAAGSGVVIATTDDDRMLTTPLTSPPFAGYSAYVTTRRWTDEQCSRLAMDPFAPFRERRKIFSIGGMGWDEEPGPPAPPTGLSATGISTSQIEVDWDTDPADTRYDVRWRRVVT